MAEQTSDEPPEHPRAADPLWEEFDAAMDTEEFAGYRVRERDIRSKFADDIGKLRDNLNEYASAVDEFSKRLADLRWSWQTGARLLFKSPVLSVVMMPVTLLLAASAIISALSTHDTLARWLLLPLSAVAVATYTVFLYQSVIFYRSAKRSAQDSLQEAEGKYHEERVRLVRESIRRHVTDVYRASGVITFPMLAPTLVELSSAKISSSRSHSDVVDFIRSHETSAIGIAGSRGSGKSTLMEAVRNLDGLASHQVHLTAPVRYEPLDFIRRLFTDVATEIVDRSGHAVEGSDVARRRRFTSQRLMRDLLTLALFIVLAVVTFLWGLTHYEWAWDWKTTVGFAAAAVLTLAVAATTVSLFRTVMRAPQTRSALIDVPRSVRLAVEALDELSWSVEEGQKETGTIKLLGGLLTLGGEDNVTRKRREQSQPELVARFREMLTQFSRDRTDPANERFVIFIDELDKLDEIDDLINAINGIKDLLHLPGVHFVVSVSIDALVRFEERGMAARDAFDSAFDTVIRMRRLTLDESRLILSSRAANFPAVLTLCCHAWSGGLARDLLRTARRCVEIQRRSSTVVHVSQILLTTVTDDMIAHVENALRAEAADTVQLDYLAELRSTVRAVAAGADPLAALRELSNDPTPGPIDHLTRTGLALLGSLSWPTDDRRWEHPPPAWDPSIEAIAASMSLRAEPAAIRDEALKHAISLAQANISDNSPSVVVALGGDHAVELTNGGPESNTRTPA